MTRYEKVGIAITYYYKMKWRTKAPLIVNKKNNENN